MKQGILLLIALILISSVVTAADSDKDYPVSEILKVRSVTEFDCRINGYKYAESARFRVQVQNVKINQQLPADETVEYLHERLKNARQILLQNVQFHNYFRVEADVLVDGRDLGQELIELGLATSTKPAAAVTDEEVSSGQTAYQAERIRRYQPEDRNTQTRPTQVTIKRQFVTMASLLNTPVDFSLVNEETTLEEALQILSDSVQPQLPLVILWNDLEANAMVEKDMPIGIGGVGKVKLKQALELVLHSVSQRAQTKLLLSLQGNVLTIGTQRGLLVKSTTRSYSIEDIVAPPFVENMGN